MERDYLYKTQNNYRASCLLDLTICSSLLLGIILLSTTQNSSFYIFILAFFVLMGLKLTKKFAYSEILFYEDKLYIKGSLEGYVYYTDIENIYPTKNTIYLTKNTHSTTSVVRHTTFRGFYRTTIYTIHKYNTLIEMVNTQETYDFLKKVMFDKFSLPSNNEKQSPILDSEIGNYVLNSLCLNLYKKNSLEILANINYSDINELTIEYPKSSTEQTLVTISYMSSSLLFPEYIEINNMPQNDIKLFTELIEKSKNI